jgi:hypothetical protein
MAADCLPGFLSGSVGVFLILQLLGLLSSGNVKVDQHANNYTDQQQASPGIELPEKYANAQEKK